MNAEKLHRILLELQKEYSTNFIGFMREVATNLSNQVGAPQEPSYQLSVSNNLTRLYELLNSSAVNDFGPNWKQILHEIGGSGLFGDQLSKRIQAIFQENANTITPATVLNSLNGLITVSDQFKAVVDQVVGGFKGLNIGYEELNPGECEFGYTIPRAAIKDQLGELGKEIRTLNFILFTISEAVTGEKEEFEIRTLSSSGIMLYVSMSLNLATFLSAIMSKIVSTYKDVIYIKDIVNGKLKKKEIPDQTLAPLIDYANQMMEKKIKEIASETIREYTKTDSGRKNELENGLVSALNILANRIDKGFIVEIRVAELPPPPVTEEIPQEDITKSENIRKIKEASKTLEYRRIEGDPILKLKESEIPEEKVKAEAKVETKTSSKK
jgi:hypothetical protein